MTTLDNVADRQAIWSATANALKSRTDLARRVSFACSIGGALAAAIASELEPGPARTILIAIGAMALATTGILTSRLLTKDVVALHIRARAASEALKREGYLYATAAGPYANPATRDATLDATLQQIEDSAEDLVLYQQQTTGKGSVPRNPVSKDDYVKNRLDGQIAYYTERSNQYAKPSRLLHIAEFSLAFLAAILTALAGALGKEVFDLAVITAVLTTLAGAVLAHLQAAKYDEMIISYRAAARSLANLKQTKAQSMSASQLAEATEEVIAAETNSWQAMWQKK